MSKMISTVCVLALVLSACGNEPKGLKARPVTGGKISGKDKTNEKPEGAFYDIAKAEYRKIEENKFARRNMIFVDRSKDELTPEEKDVLTFFACTKNILAKTNGIQAILLQGQSQIVIRQSTEKRNPDLDKNQQDEDKKQRLLNFVSPICLAANENFEEQLKLAKNLRHISLKNKEVVKVDQAYLNKNFKTSIRVVCLDDKNLAEVPDRLTHGNADTAETGPLENYYSDIVMMKGASILIPEEFKDDRGNKSNNLLVRCQ